MAIFSRQKNIPAIKQDVAAADQAPAKEAETQKTEVVLNVPATRGLIVPRLSEKAGALGRLNKYVFTVTGNINKVEVKKAVEKQYGVKIADINMIVMQGKVRRRGNRYGRTSSFKKAIVTLTKNSKKIDLVEPN